MKKSNKQFLSHTSKEESLLYILEKLGISSSTYQKYKNPSWIDNNKDLDFSSNIAEYEKRRKVYLERHAK